MQIPRGRGDVAMAHEALYHADHESCGRTDSFFVYESGAAVHWPGMTSVLLGDPGVVEFQVSQTVDGADVSVAAKEGCNIEGLRRGLVDLMSRPGLTDPEVTIREVDGFDHLWSGKLRQFQPL